MTLRAALTIAALILSLHAVAAPLAHVPAAPRIRVPANRLVALGGPKLNAAVRPGATKKSLAANPAAGPGSGAAIGAGRLVAKRGVGAANPDKNNRFSKEAR